MESKAILSKISCPGDLKALDNKSLALLCSEIREEIINTVSKNGGHLASNLGAVELTCCLEKVFWEPENAIIFDVGHQSYTHKLLTGRQERFNTLRQKDGISGFQRPDESPYDKFITGHSSTAVSVASGISSAKRLCEESGQAVAVVGDGAMTGGIFYEGIDNLASSTDKVIVVVNDNEMSISKNIGGIARHLAKITSRASYFRFKDFLKRFLKGIPLIGDAMFSAASGIRDFIKRIFVRGNFFTDMGLKYLGPVDGHDIKQLLAVFGRAKKLESSVVVHCITVKGKGFTKAEKDPSGYHSTAPFEIVNGVDENPTEKSFSSEMGDCLCELAHDNPKICAVTASMCCGTGLDRFREEYPDRFFDVGIAEQHAVTFCAALAAGGMVPVFAVYSSFLQRGYDQLIHDVAIQGLHVVFCVDRAGFVGADGETHNGMFDVAYFNTIPGFTVYSPGNFSELRLCIERAILSDGPVVVRYPRGGDADNTDYSFDCSDYSVIQSEGKLLAVGYGRTATTLEPVVKQLCDSAPVSFMKLVRIKPFNHDAVIRAMDFETVVFFEEAVLSASVGEKFSSELAKSGFKGKFVHICVKDEFIAQASVQSQLSEYGLTGEQMLQTLSSLIDGGEHGAT